jgi:hypothetical protein
MGTDSGEHAAVNMDMVEKVAQATDTTVPKAGSR